MSIKKKNTSTSSTTDADPQSNEQQPTSSPLIELAIVTRLRKLALINQTFEMMEHGYDRLKTSNSMLEATISQAESMAAKVATPIIQKFQQPIHLVDNLACQGLDKFENSVTTLSKYPMIETAQKRFEETFEMLCAQSKQVRTLIDANIEQTSGRIETIRKNSTEKIHSMLNISETFIKTVENTLNAAESAIDRLLPPLKPETDSSSPSSNQESSPIQPTSKVDLLRHLFQRMVRFSDKLRRRIWQHTEEKWLKSGMIIGDGAAKIINNQQTSSNPLSANESAVNKKAKQS